MINYADWDKQITIPKMSGTEFINKYGEYLIRSFTAIKVEFTFPNNVVFPNLPVRLDKGSLMYPLSGQSFCTGLEILLAHRLGCQFIVLGGSFIPFINTPAALTLYREQSDLTMDLKAEQTVSVRNLNKTIKTLGAKHGLLILIYLSYLNYHRLLGILLLELNLKSQLYKPLY